MVKYLQFLNVGTTGELQEKLGSDGVCPLDGRWSLGTIKSQARMEIQKRKKVASDIVGYRVMVGERCFNATCHIHQWVRSGTVYNGREL